MTPKTAMLRSKLRRELRCNVMPIRPRALLSVLLALLALGLVAACGGDGDAADGSTDVDQLLKDTFSGGKAIDSGRLDASLGVQAGSSSSLDIKLGGPFQSTGEGRLPKLALHATFAGGGQTLEGGVTSTGDQGFVSFGGTDYEVAGPVFEQFKARYEEAAKKSSGQQGQSLASLGIDPRRWLTNARNAGESKVGDTDTVKITGDVDVPRLLDDINWALGRIRSLGVQGAGELPEQLTDSEKQQAADAIKDLKVEIDTGAEDRILRRIVISMRVETPEGVDAGGARAADVRFALQLLDVNEDQDISAPENPKPFEQLADKLGGLGLGGLGGGAGSGSGSGGTGEANLEKYSKCIRDAGGDEGKIRKCADLLATP